MNKEQQKNPAISVVMPVYNGEKYLKAAIKSILDQSFKDFEFIIIDDASTDASAEVVRSFNDPRIKFHVNEKNERISHSLNRGIKNASGKYIARMDQDDISFPERLEIQMNYLDRNPNITVLGSWTEIISPEGASLNRNHSHYTDPDELRFWFQFDCYLVHPSVMFRKEVWEAAGGYTTDPNRQPEDFDFWTVTLRRFEMANLPKALLYYRESPNSMSRGNREEFERHLEQIGTRYIAYLQHDINQKKIGLYRKYFQIGNFRPQHLTMAEKFGLLRIHLKSVFNAAKRKPTRFIRLFVKTRAILKAIMKNSIHAKVI